MDNGQEHTPPEWILTIFRLFCHPAYREDIEGDLREHYNAKLARMGRPAANRSLLKEVLLLIKPGITGYMQHQKNNNIQQVNLAKLLFLNLLVVLMILSPFIPGPSNKIVFWLSISGQLAGTAGLILVPIGLSWLTIEATTRKRESDAPNKAWSYYNLAIATITLIAVAFIIGAIAVPNPMPKATMIIGFLFVLTGFVISNRQATKWKGSKETVITKKAIIILAGTALACVTFIYLFAVLFIFVGIGMIPGIIAFLLLPPALLAALKQLKKLKTNDDKPSAMLPLCFTTIPLVGFVTFLFLVTPASNFSRDLAIKKGQQIIAAIEDYKAKVNTYPASLEELSPGIVKEMSDPLIMGAEGFRYHKIEDRYSLSFSQWLDLGSLEEIVMYDKDDLKNNLTGRYSNYSYKVDLWRVKGAFAIHTTKYDYWKYYHVD